MKTAFGRVYSLLCCVPWCAIYAVIFCIGLVRSFVFLDVYSKSVLCSGSIQRRHPIQQTFALPVVARNLRMACHFGQVPIDSQLRIVQEVALIYSIIAQF